MKLKNKNYLYKNWKVKMMKLINSYIIPRTFIQNYKINYCSYKIN